MGNKNDTLSCRLTFPELMERKATVIGSLKQLLLERQAIHNGFRYRFYGSDELLDLLITFIKTERLCSGFFKFKIMVSGGESPVWLELSGPEGVKEFILNEIGL
jgi:hypothetical protein